VPPSPPPKHLAERIAFNLHLPKPTVAELHGFPRDDQPVVLNPDGRSLGQSSQAAGEASDSEGDQFATLPWSAPCSTIALRKNTDIKCLVPWPEVILQKICYRLAFAAGSASASDFTGRRYGRGSCCFSKSIKFIACRCRCNPYINMWHVAACGDIAAASDRKS